MQKIQVSYSSRIFTVSDKAAKEVQKFEEMQTKYSKFGAADTEPGGVFAGMVEDADDGQDFDFNDPQLWELFYGSMKCSRAHNALTRQAKIVYGLIRVE